MNSDIKYHILSDEKMREFGFTDYDNTRWYYCKELMIPNTNKSHITFNMIIPKKDVSEGKVYVVDEYLLQPIDFMHYIEYEITQYIFIQVEIILDAMRNAGIISGFNI